MNHPFATNPGNAVAAFFLGCWLSAPLALAQNHEFAPEVHQVAPLAGPSKGGTQVLLTGNRFSPEALVFFGDQPATSVELVSPHELIALSPQSGDDQESQIRVVQTSGECAFPDPFVYENVVPGDIDGDQEVTPFDASLALQVCVGDAVDQPLHLSGDVNSDGRIGLEEAHYAAAHGREPNELLLADLPGPELILTTPGVQTDQPAEVFVKNLGFFGPATIDWGDGATTDILTDGVYTHPYAFTGEFAVTLLSEDGLTEPQPIFVHDDPFFVEAVELNVEHFRFTGEIQRGPVVEIDPELALELPPMLSIEVHANGIGAIEGEVYVENPDGDRERFPITLEVDPSIAPDGALMMQVPVPLQPAPGIHAIGFQLAPNINAAPAARFPVAAVVVVPNFVTQADCERIRQQWRALVAAKAKKKQECDALKKQLAFLEWLKARMEAAKKALEARRDALQQDLADTQKDFDDLSKSISDFYRGTAQFINYENAGDFPAGRQHIGVRTKGASTGVGFAFDSVEALLSRNDAYKRATGRSIGSDLKKLRDMIKKMDGLKKQLQNLNQSIANLDAALKALCKLIDDLKKKIEKCVAECKKIEKDIKDHVDAHADCLRKLEEQRQAKNKLRGGKNNGRGAQDDVDRTNRDADNADDVIDGRGGSPGQVQDDQDEVETGRRCAREAQDLVDAGKRKLAAAEQALANGDTETANRLTDEANALFQEAREKAAAAREHINTGSSRARQRKRRQCEEGSERTLTQRWVEVTAINDLALVAMGRTPEEWASFFENADELISGLEIVSGIASLPGSPISGDTSLDIRETAETLIGAFKKLAERLGLDVYAKVTRVLHTKTTKQRCIHGCWQTVETTETTQSLGTRTVKIRTPDLGGKLIGYRFEDQP